jgi:putative mRNA 3-end processing factor
VDLPKTLPLGSIQPGQVVVLPSHPRSRRYLPEIGPHRVCLLSGRAVEHGYAEQIGVDLALPLSDHAGFADLVQYAVRSGASRVLTVHGYAEDLAGELRKRGVRAQSIREHHRQLELF